MKSSKELILLSIIYKKILNIHRVMTSNCTYNTTWSVLCLHVTHVTIGIDEVCMHRQRTSKREILRVNNSIR